MLAGIDLLTTSSAQQRRALTASANEKKGWSDSLLWLGSLLRWPGFLCACWRRQAPWHGSSLQDLKSQEDYDEEYDEENDLAPYKLEEESYPILRGIDSLVKIDTDMFEGIEKLEGPRTWSWWTRRVQSKARMHDCHQLLDGTERRRELPKDLSVKEHKDRVWLNAVRSRKNTMLLSAIMGAVSDDHHRRIEHLTEARDAITILDERRTPIGVIQLMDQSRLVHSPSFSEQYATFADFLNRVNDEVEFFDRFQSSAEINDDMKRILFCGALGNRFREWVNLKALRFNIAGTGGPNTLPITFNELTSDAMRFWDVQQLVLQHDRQPEAQRVTHHGQHGARQQGWVHR